MPDSPRTFVNTPTPLLILLSILLLPILLIRLLWDDSYAVLDELELRAAKDKHVQRD